MKKHSPIHAIRIMAIALFTVLMAGCYNDDDIWSEVNNLKEEVATLKQDLTYLQTTVSALQSAKFITDYQETETGAIITFNDGNTITLKNGAAGTNAPVVGVKAENDVYYWTLTTNGVTEFLLVDGQKLPVVGAIQKLGVDADGYWTIDGIRMKDANGAEVKANDQFFASIDATEMEVTFTMNNGTVFTIPTLKGANSFSFVKPEDGNSYFVFDFSEKRTLTLKMDKITSVDILKAPAGWTVTINKSAKTVTVKAPAYGTSTYDGGIITLVGIHENGNTMFASTEVCASIDYTDINGTFVVCEGNMTTANGTVYFYDKLKNEYANIFENANNGLEIGNVVQDMYMANGKIYLMTQNGSNMNGAGRFVVCDAHTMKMEYADPLVIKTPAGKATWPQHFVVVSPTLAYVQYSEAGMEATSGIAALTLSDGAVKVGATVDGTFGAFTTEGATKTRMVYSRGKVYAGCGNKVVIIDPASSTIIKSIPFDGHQVKGIAKGADGNIYFPIAGTFTGGVYNPTFTSAAQMIGIDHDGNVLSTTDMPAQVVLPVATWSPAVGFCSSFTKPYVYFVDSSDFSAVTASRYNTSTATTDVNYLKASNTIYGIMGVHPTTEEYWVGQSSYVDSDIYVYSTTGVTPTETSHFKYSNQRGASPAGIDFVYRFSDEWINK